MSTPSDSHPYPIVRTTAVGKTHYLKVETNDPNDITRATKTLCNVDRNNAPVMTQTGLLTTCKRCLKIAEMNAARTAAGMSNSPELPVSATVPAASETINGQRSVISQPSLPSTAWNIPF